MKDLSGRLAKVNEVSKNNCITDYSENNNINNNGMFTGRTIKFISNEISDLNKNKMIDDENITQEYLNNVILSTFEHYYYNSFEGSKSIEDFQNFKMT